MTSSLAYRRDVRSNEVFEDNIGDYSERELYWSYVFREECNARGIHCIRVDDNGVDGSGALIEGRLANYNADKVFCFEDREDLLVEIKSVPPESPYFTFKVHCLEQYIQQGACLLVPRLGEHYDWHMFKHRSLRMLLDNYPHAYYANFSSNDIAVRIWNADINRMINEGLVTWREWTPMARSVIRRHYGILTRKKRTR